jgi:hypothetical protein
MDCVKEAMSSQPDPHTTDGVDKGTDPPTDPEGDLLHAWEVIQITVLPPKLVGSNVSTLREYVDIGIISATSFIVAATQPLLDVQVIAIQNVLASEQEIMLDALLHAWEVIQITVLPPKLVGSNVSTLREYVDIGIHV